MGKSLDFCRGIATNLLRSPYSDRAWNAAEEFIDTDTFYDEVYE